MDNDEKKLKRFIRTIENCAPNMPYMEMLNVWMGETGDSLSGPDELEYLLRLIPLIQKREKQRTAANTNK